MRDGWARSARPSPKRTSSGAARRSCRRWGGSTACARARTSRSRSAPSRTIRSSRRRPDRRRIAPSPTRGGRSIRTSCSFAARASPTTTPGARSSWPRSPAATTCSATGARPAICAPRWRSRRRSSRSHATVAPLVPRTSPRSSTRCSSRARCSAGEARPRSRTCGARRRPTALGAGPPCSGGSSDPYVADVELEEGTSRDRPAHGRRSARDEPDRRRTAAHRGAEPRRAALPAVVREAQDGGDGQKERGRPGLAGRLRRDRRHAL